ncbi:MAG: hypothetical protein KDG52_16770 [Rhodocyclaceae bacterium]|nr:hypothetical protein [Rhodocyclaceae bacterium]
MQRQVFVFWTGSNPMSPARRRSLAAMAATGCEVSLVTAQNLHDFVSAEEIHPAYPYLNLAHRADYLRCHFMLRHGGGYADLKPVGASWQAAFERLDSDPALWAVGYPEIGPRGVANLYQSSLALDTGAATRARAWLQWKLLRRRHRQLIGLCAFVFRADTPLARSWWIELNRRLDRLLPALQANPARAPRERPGDLVDGMPSRYPVPWTHLLGDIFHPLVARHHRHIDRSLPAPGFTDYL